MLLMIPTSLDYLPLLSPRCITLLFISAVHLTCGHSTCLIISQLPSNGNSGSLCWKTCTYYLYNVSCRVPTLFQIYTVFQRSLNLDVPQKQHNYGLRTAWMHPASMHLRHWFLTTLRTMSAQKNFKAEMCIFLESHPCYIYLQARACYVKQDMCFKLGLNSNKVNILKIAVGTKFMF